MRKNIKCGACGHIGITIGDCASECESCGASVNPDNGTPYMDNGKVVHTYQFGGINFP